MKICRFLSNFICFGVVIAVKYGTDWRGRLVLKHLAWSIRSKQVLGSLYMRMHDTKYTQKYTRYIRWQMYIHKVYYLYMYPLLRNSDTIEPRFHFILYIYIYIKNFDLCIIGFLLVHLSRNIPLLRKGTGKTRLYLSTSQQRIGYITCFKN